MCAVSYTRPEMKLATGSSAAATSASQTAAADRTGTVTLAPISPRTADTRAIHHVFFLGALSFFGSSFPACEVDGLGGYLGPVTLSPQGASCVHSTLGRVVGKSGRAGSEYFVSSGICSAGNGGPPGP